MEFDWGVLIQLVVVAFGSGFFVNFMNARNDSRRVDIEQGAAGVVANDSNVAGAQKVVGMQENLLNRYHEENDVLRGRVTMLERRVDVLESFIRLNTEFDPLHINGDYRIGEPTHNDSGDEGEDPAPPWGS